MITNLLNHLGRDFWIYRLGQFFSGLGDSCTQVALYWWLLQHLSPVQVGTILSISMIADIFLPPLLAPLGDRYPRKNLMILASSCQLVLAAVFAFVAYTNFFSLPLILTLIPLYYLFKSLFLSGATGLLAFLVPRERYNEGLRQTQIINTIGMVIGGVIAGVVLHKFGVSKAFFLDSISFLILMIAVLFISVRKIDSNTQKKKEHPIILWKNDLFDGIKFIQKNQLLLIVSLMIAGLNFFFAPFTLVVSTMITNNKVWPAWTLGTFQTSLAVGSLLGLFLLNRLLKNLSSSSLFISLVIVEGVAAIIMSAFTSLASILLIPMVFGIVSAVTTTLVLRQLNLFVPDSYRSRFFSIFELMVRLMNPLGVFLGGVFLSNYQPATLLLMNGILLIIFTIAVCSLSYFKTFMSYTLANFQEKSVTG
ncbi:MAG: MFS transporter [Oligoflexia bacterium]|nr:MFS transporter [Oligoflexia bacterium]